MKKGIISYLKNTATNLLLIDCPKTETAVKIQRALDIKTGKYFSQYHRSKLENQIYWRVIEERANRKYGDKGKIFDDIGDEFNLSGHAIKKIFDEVKKDFDEYEKIDQEEKRIYLMNQKQ